MSGCRLHVAVGVIVVDGLVLIARRPAHLHQGGRWEFPGGKVEAGEGVEQALARELGEELGLTVGAARPFMEIAFDYPERSVLLDTWLVEEVAGAPRGLEGQELRWVAPGELGDYEFPEANRPIVERLVAELIKETSAP